MKSDIEIAQEAEKLRIEKVAEKYDIPYDSLELYGKYKAKLTEDYLRELDGRPDGKLVLVTAINPTPAGEGKTTTTIGLVDALNKRRSSRRRICTGCPYGRAESPFHR